MANREKALSEGEILSAIVAPEKASLSVEAARSLLQMKFTRAQESRMHELADKNNAGELTTAERMEMENYVRIGNFLSLVQSKARLSIQANSRS